jgi:MerR family transcriptional regulator, light-induced transcriptional regulator
MKETYISTREAAALLSVTETTVKRWTDSGRLKCMKTLGGHRKYLLEDIEDFAKENGIPVSGVSSPLSKSQLDKVGYALYTKNWNQITEVVIEEALQGDADGLFDLFIYLSKNRIRFGSLIDEIVQPALEKVGYMWGKKQINIEDEHLASGAVKTSLARLIVYLPRQRGKNIKVLCACSEGEHHDIGIRSLAYELELNGYTIHYLGADTPFSSIQEAVKKEKPSYIFISSTAPVLPEEDFIKSMKRLTKTSASVKSKVLFGGNYAQKFRADSLGCDAVVASIKDVNNFLKTNKS